MANIVSTTDTALQASGTSYTVTLGTHAANDVLLVCVSNDGAGASISTPSGWAAFGTAAVSQATMQAWFYKVASGSGTTNPTFTVANAATVGTALVIRGASATPADGWQRIDWGNSSTIKTAVSTAVAASSAGGTTAITPSANALLIYSFSCDGSSRYMRTSTADMIPVSKVVGSGVNHIIGYRQHGQSGNPAAVTMYADIATEGGNGWVLSIADDGSGTIEKDGHSADVVAQWYGNFGILHAGLSDEAVPLTWRALSTFCGSVGTINSIACSSTAPTVDNAVVMTSQAFATGTSLASTESTAGAWVGGYHTLTSTDMTGKLFHLTYQMNNVVGTRHGAEGMVIVFSDGTNYAAYKWNPKAAMVANETKTLTIALGSASTYATSGSINWGAVTQIAYMFHRIGSSGTATSFTVQNAVLATKTTLVGGDTTRRLTPAFLPSVFSGWGMYKQVDLQGSAQVLGRTGVQIGDGGVKTYFDASASSVEYPVTYDGTTQAFWNCNANTTGITVKASANDVIDFSSCVLATTVSELFTIDAASSASATYSFAGASLVGWKVTDNIGISWTGTTFKGGDVVTIAGGGDMTNCTIKTTTSTGAALSITANGSTLDGTTIDVTGTSAAYHLELGTAVTAITLTDVTFTGTPGTDKVHVLKASGTVTITISGTTSLVAGDVTSAGATVVIAAPELYQSAAITGLAATYRIQLFDIEYDLTVSGITVTPTAGATYTHNGITWTVRSTSIVAGAGTMTVYGAGTPSASGTLTKASGTGDASVTFSAYVVDGTELYIGVPGATSYTWTDSVAAAAPRVIRLRVMEDGPGTSDAILMIDSIIGVCGITEGAESVGYLVAAVADDVYNDRGVDGSTVTGITIDDSTLRLEIASGTIVNYNGTDVLVIDGRDIYAYETYWLGTTAGMRDQARFIEAVDAVNFRCSNFKLLGTSGYPIMIRNCYMVDAATGIFASLVDYSGDPISNAPDHMAAIVVSTSDSVVTGSLSEFIAAVPTANAIANQVVNGITFP